MTEDIKLEIVPLQQDYNRAKNIIAYNSLLSRKDIFIALIGLLLSIFIWIFFSHAPLMILLIAFFSLFFMFIALYYLVIPMWNYQNRVKGLGNVTLMIGDNGIESFTPDIQSKVGWEFFKGVWETNEFFILLGKGKQFNLIPKRAFTDNNQLNRFKDILQTHLIPLERKK